MENIQTFVSNTISTNVFELFKGYSKLHVLETYGTFWLITKGLDSKIKLEQNQEYDLKDVIEIGHYMQEGRKSLPSFNYFLSN